MKNALLPLVVIGLLTACGRSEKTQDNTLQSTTATVADSTVATEAPKPKNCQSIVAADKLGKSNEYQESAKSIKVTLTLEQDTSTMPTANGCYFNNTVTVLATKKSGSRVFKRTLVKDDLAYFTKNDASIEKSLLQNAVYKPTFNGQKYVTITMRMVDPETKKSTDYTVYMNYFGEIVKAK